jgi:hypothetical protein
VVAVLERLSAAAVAKDIVVEAVVLAGGSRRD